MNKIDYIQAHNGGIQFLSGLGNVVGYATTPKMVAYILQTKGIADSLFHSSSMDFASEDGFESDGDAWKLFDAGLEVYMN